MQDKIQKWVADAKKRIENNDETIEEVEFMVKSDYSNHKDDLYRAKTDNKFLLEGIELISLLDKTQTEREKFLEIISLEREEIRSLRSQLDECQEENEDEDDDLS